nr:hypothetical protein DBT53_13075 [Aerococcus mictus]
MRAAALTAGYWFDGTRLFDQAQQAGNRDKQRPAGGKPPRFQAAVNRTVSDPGVRAAGDRGGLSVGYECSPFRGHRTF